jgi:hypothetical protein
MAGECRFLSSATGSNGLVPPLNAHSQQSVKSVAIWCKCHLCSYNSYKGTGFISLVIEVAIGEYDADIADLAAEAAKSISERRKVPRITTGGTEEVPKTISGKGQKSINCNMQVQQPAFVRSNTFGMFIFTVIDYYITGRTKFLTLFLILLSCY